MKVAEKALVGYFDYENNRLESEVIYRFPNGFVLKDGHKIWDLNHLFAEVKNTIKEALKKYSKIETMSIDAWGCDYVLLDKDDKEIFPCYSYRDERTLSILDEAFSLISKREIFNLTGSQFQSFNTIFQLYKDKVEGRLEKAENFLMIPEYLIFKLTGVKVHELTNASTTSLLEKDKYEYSKTIIGKLNLPEKLFKNPAKVGYFVGNLLNEVEKEVGGNIKVKLCATHDTASAIRLIEDKIDENSWTEDLWKMQTESIVVFPEGIGVLPWILCGGIKIGKATAEKMKEYRAVVWSQHGLFSTGRDLDEVFGLIETIEKAAEIYMKILGHKVYSTITNDNLKEIAGAFNLNYKKGIID